MNPALIQLALYIRDLLDYDEQLIKFGRDNNDLPDTSAGYIVIDELSSIPLGKEEIFDGENESMEYSSKSNGQVVITTYGDVAYSNLAKIRNLQGSLKSYELQRDLGIAVFMSKAITDLRFLGGTQFSKQYELEITLQYSDKTDVETLRIDEAQTTFIFDN